MDCHRRNSFDFTITGFDTHTLDGVFECLGELKKAGEIDYINEYSCSGKAAGAVVGAIVCGSLVAAKGASLIAAGQVVTIKCVIAGTTVVASPVTVVVLAVVGGIIIGE